MLPYCVKYCPCEVGADKFFVHCEQAYEKKTTPKWRYDLGRRKNFEQVCMCCIKNSFGTLFYIAIFFYVLYG